MTITATNQVRLGNMTTVTVTSGLAGTVYYHWYLDGAWVGQTMSPSRSFYLEQDDEVRLEVLDTNSDSYDPIANAPAGYPARRTITWNRSTDADTVRYRVEQQQDGGAWAAIGEVVQDASTWQHSLLTPRLVDLASYAWRVYPIDAAGNDGTALTFAARTIVRTPDAPAFTLSFNGGTTRVTFEAA